MPTSVAVLALLWTGAACFGGTADRPPAAAESLVPADSHRYRRLAGLYQLASDTVITIGYEFFDDPELAYVEWQSGQYRRLFPTSDTTFVAGPGREIPDPAQVTVTFPNSGAGLRWHPTGRPEQYARRIELYRQEEVRIPSTDITLAGTLITPLTPGPHPGLIFMHGSGPTIRYSFRSDPYFFASRGIAALVYDKRGTGFSGGKFEFSADSAWFTKLAADGMAAVRFMTKRAEIDPKRIGLWGISQAGWTVPMVAAQASDVAFVVIVSGPAVTVGQEGLFSRLTGDDPGGPGALGREEIARRMRASRPEGFDPAPYLERMRVPGLWLFGGLDQSIPAEMSVEALDRFRRDDTRDITITTFPKANHILLEAETGRRDESPRLTRFVPGYFETMIQWVRTRVKPLP